MCGTAVDLGRLDMPSHVLATQEDHIIPWRAVSWWAARANSCSAQAATLLA